MIRDQSHGNTSLKLVEPKPDAPEQIREAGAVTTRLVIIVQHFPISIISKPYVGSLATSGLE